MGKKLDLLLQIIKGGVEGFKLPENISIDENKVQIELVAVKREQTVTINGNVFVINADTPEGKKVVREIMASSEKLLDRGDRIIEADFNNLITDAETHIDEEDADIALMQRLRGVIPDTDLPIVESALFIRRLHRSKGSVERYKGLVYQKYGARGNNITNLCTANYYDNYLLPLYGFLCETEGELAKQIFHEIYEEAVTQYPFAVFVSNNKDYSALKEQILTKIRLNLLSDQHSLNIHGIGNANKKTIIQLIKDSDIANSFTAEPDILEDIEATIFARIFF